MKKQIYEAPKMPSAIIAVNKSRIKLYNNTGDMPTYYLQSGQEFQIELFNPTTDVVLAKIILNGKPISQGGLVLNPGQRIFLERYLDVAKKFLFDTYEVSNTSEAKEAIVKNGDFKVEFYRESAPVLTHTQTNGLLKLSGYNSGTDHLNLKSTTDTARGFGACPTQSIGGGSACSYSANITPTVPTMDFLDNSIKGTLSFPPVEPKSFLRKSIHSKRSKSIETGRVEKGSDSDQKVVTVDKKFEYMAFHTIECKMLPISQKVNTVADIQVKVYCTNCAHKLKKEYKFCPVCATRVKSFFKNLDHDTHPSFL
jgi:hypothetical protein